MNRAEANHLLMRAAKQWPGKITVNRDVRDTWANALADMDPTDGGAAYDEHVRSSDFPASPANLWAAHRRLGDAPTGPRPEIAPPAIHVAAAHEAPEVAHAELAKMRAILGPATPYRGRR